MRTVILCLLLLVTFFSCKKDGGNEPSGPMQFAITGLPDTANIEQVDTVEIPLSVNLISGRQERVTLQVSGLPSNMSASFTPSIDTPGFTSVFKLVTNGTPLGNYTITITASDTKKTESYSFAVAVSANPVNPASVVLGKYRETGPCQVAGNIDDTVRIEEVVPFFNKIRIVGLNNGNPNTVVLADFDEVNYTIDIPQQTVNGAIFTGAGIYNSGTITIGYSMDFGFGKDTCNVILNKL